MAGVSISNLRGKRTRRALSEINVVPYIDVMLVLLVIFMVTAPMIAPSVVNLPTIGNAAPQPQMPPVIVNIRAGGELSILYKEGDVAREQTMTSAALTAFLQRRQPMYANQPVVIAADKRVQYDAVMKVMSELKQQGIKRVGLLVKSP